MAIHGWETGKAIPRPYNGRALAAVLHTPIEVLLEEDPSAEAPGPKVRQNQTAREKEKCEL
jgi:hypothetical protein